MNREESIAFAKKYLEDIVSFFGVNLEIAAGVDGDVIQLSAPNTYLSSLLIGTNGDVLRGLQTLVRAALSAHDAELERVNIDIADYKKRKNYQLAQQVEKWVKIVRATGEPKILRPMSAAERFVVHKILVDFPDISGASEGVGRERHVVLRKKSGEEKIESADNSVK